MRTGQETQAPGINFQGLMDAKLHAEIRYPFTELPVYFVRMIPLIIKRHVSILLSLQKNIRQNPDKSGSSKPFVAKDRHKNLFNPKKGDIFWWLSSIKPVR